MHIEKTLSNNKIKEIKKLHLKKYRDESGLFIAEGEKATDEIINENINIIDIFCLNSYKETIKSNKITIITEDEMKKISTTSSVCEIMAIAKKRDSKINPNKNNKIILLDKISDPGNLGTIIRSAAAFDVDGIILFGDTVELYSPKVIRSCAGNFFKIPVITIKDTNELNKIFPEHTYIGTALRNSNNISFADAKKLNKKVIMFGSEAHGLSDELINIATKNIVLNMKNNVESLNLSISASIILYELL